ncbi:hypothetical protein [Bacillus sp. m3-13]|uniref:hypothetical protein n=1 Tax=Bacillus sp. m3-13 TaxID=406124 RepID=UPI0001E89886|nr:hypothetical protein [Bacillus sp. m3-13]
MKYIIHFTVCILIVQLLFFFDFTEFSFSDHSNQQRPALIEFKIKWNQLEKN